MNKAIFVQFVHFFHMTPPVLISLSSKVFEFVLNFPIFYLISLQKYV